MDSSGQTKRSPKPEAPAGPAGSRAWQAFLILLFLLMVAITGWRLKATLKIGWGRTWAMIDSVLIHVDPGSEAYEAGIRPGDQLLSHGELRYVLPDGRVKTGFSREDAKAFARVNTVGTTSSATFRRLGSPGRPGSGEQSITTQVRIVEKPGRTLQCSLAWLGTVLAAIVALWYGAGRSAPFEIRLVCLGMILLHGFISLLPTFSMNDGFWGSDAHNVIGVVTQLWQPVFIHILLTWPAAHPWKKRVPSLPYWIYGVHAAFLAFQLWWYFARLHLTVFFLLHCGAALLFVMAAAVTAIQSYRRSGAWQRQQSRWFQLNLIHMAAFVLVSALAGGAALSLGPLGRPEFQWQAIVAQGYLNTAWSLIGAPTLAITWIMAISRYRLDLVETVFRRAVTYAVTAVVLVVFLLVAGGGLALAAQRWAAVREPPAVIGLPLSAQYELRRGVQVFHRSLRPERLGRVALARVAVAVNEDRPAACGPRGGEVSRRVTDAPGAGEVEPELPCGRQQKTRPRLPALALVVGPVRADVDPVESDTPRGEELAQVLVHGGELLRSQCSLRDARLIAEGHQEKPRLAKPSQALRGAGEEPEVPRAPDELADRGVSVDGPVPVDEYGAPSSAEATEGGVRRSAAGAKEGAAPLVRLGGPRPG